MILTNLLPVIGVSIVMAFLYAASKKKSKQDGLGNIILQLPKLYSIIGVLIIIGGLGLFLFAFFFANENDKILASICGLIAMISGLLLFLKGYIFHIKVTDIEIIETTMFGKQKKIKLNEIVGLSFGKISLELKISSPDTNIKAHMHLVRFQELVTILLDKTGKTKIEIGIPD